MTEMTDTYLSPIETPQGLIKRRRVRRAVLNEGIARGNDYRSVWI